MPATRVEAAPAAAASNGDLDALAARLKGEVERWAKADFEARQEAERARNRAETERDAAQEVRKEAMLALIEEQAQRAEAERAQQALAAEKRQLAQQLQQEQARSEGLASQVKALQAELQRQQEGEALRAQELERQLAASQEALGEAAREAAAWQERCGATEREAEELAGRARAIVASAQMKGALQDGLKQKAELDFQEATRELAAAQDALSAASVEKQLLRDRLETLQGVAKQLEESNASLAARLEAAEGASTQQAQQESEELRRRVAELEASLAGAHAELAAQQAEVEAEAGERLVLAEAMAEAQRSQQELRSAWHRAENAVHEMSRARAEAEAGKHRLMEALVKERAARILAQQELERAAESDGSGGVGGSSTGRSSRAGIDQARLALLHEELAAEAKALDLILEALKELNTQQSVPSVAPDAPSTPCK